MSDARAGSKAVAAIVWLTHSATGDGANRAVLGDFDDALRSLMVTPIGR